MGHRYLDSTATQASPYETTTDAANLLKTISDIALAVDEVVWVKSTHSETSGTAKTAPASATPANPLRVLAVTDFDASPTSLVTSAGPAYLSTNSSTHSAWNGHWHFHGQIFDFRYGSSSSGVAVFGNTASPHSQSFKFCIFKHSTAGWTFGPNVSSSNDEMQWVLNECEFWSSTTTAKVVLGQGRHRMSGISLGGTGTPTTLFDLKVGVVADILIENSDLSGKAWTNLFSIPASTQARIVVRNCKMPSSWVAYTGTIGAPGTEMIFDNCSDADDNYVHRRYSYSGSVVQETTIVPAAGGASDGTTTISWKMVSLATCSIFEPLYSEWINVWVDDTSTAITPALELLVSGDGAAALTDKEVWIECDAMVTASTPKATRSTDRVAQVIDAGANQAAGSLTWNGHGYATPTTHKLAVGSLTPTKKGFIRCRYALAKASTTIYGNRKIALS